MKFPIIIMLSFLIPALIILVCAIVGYFVERNKTDIVSRAKRYALKCHRSTNHRYGDKPYEYHLKMVYEYGLKYRHLLHDEETQIYALATCWTHDVMEDTRQTFSHVEKELGTPMANFNYAMTNEKGKNRRERKNHKYFYGVTLYPETHFRVEPDIRCLAHIERNILNFTDTCLAKSLSQCLTS